MTEPPAPRPYQVTGREFLEREGRAFLGDEPGLGKSRQLVEAARGDTLVMAPAMVLDGGNWVDEVGKWPNPHADFTQAAYSGLNARERTGKGTGTKPVLRLRPEVDRRWDTLILDECHYVKGRQTSWTWAARELAKRADRVFLATGTPIPNWPHELFVPLQILYPDEAKPGRRFGSFHRWRDEWFRTKPSRYSEFEVDVVGLWACGPKCDQRPPWDPCDHYREFVERNLGSKWLQRLRDDVLTDLPPLTEETIECPMTAKQATEYRRMKKEFLAEVDGEEVVAWSSAAKNVLLDRMTTGLGLVAEPYSSAESGKLKRLEYDLTSRSRPTLVVAHYKSSVEQAAATARSLGASSATIHGGTSKKDRLNRVRAFQAGQLDVLCGSLETISEGLTLTAADMCIFLEKSYKPSRNTQAMRRIHRLGQTRPCTVLDYVATLPNGGRTLDGSKRELLERKTDMQMRVLTAAQFASLL